MSERLYERGRFILIVLFFCVVLSTNDLHAQERRYEIYGYGQLDFTTSNRVGAVSGFNQKRLNLIEEFFIDKNIRVLSDVEFEGGEDITVNDPTSFGTIKISRAWMEYTVASELKIRGGKMLTPFGLYNLIHDAAASYYPVDPPVMYSDLTLFSNQSPQRLFSKYYVGVEVLGTFDLDKSGSQLEYSVGIGNGRGLNVEGDDLNNNRSISARIMYRPSFLEGMQFGTSFYSDRNYYGIAGVTNDLEYAYAIDLQFENNYFHIQAEGLTSSYLLTTGVRRTTGIGYVQLGYTLFDVLTPFANYSVVLYDMTGHDYGFSRFNFGLNYAVSPNLFLKTEIQFHQSEEQFSKEAFNVFKFSAAIAF